MEPVSLPPQAEGPSIAPSPERVLVDNLVILPLRLCRPRDDPPGEAEPRITGQRCFRDAEEGVLARAKRAYH